MRSRRAGEVAHGWWRSRVTPGQFSRIACTSSAAASITCSQLSKNQNELPRGELSAERGPATVGRDPESVSRSTDATVAVTSPASRTPERSTVHNPSTYDEVFASALATSIARRVLPAPPGPQSVTRRFLMHSATSSSISRWRPMNRVAGLGR